MTVYACSAPFDQRVSGQVVERFNLWADDSDEAWIALMAIGVDPDAARRQECNAWEVYAIDKSQLDLAASLSVTITDRWGPVLWLAERDGNSALVERVLQRRAN